MKRTTFGFWNNSVRCAVVCALAMNTAVQAEEMTLGAVKAQGAQLLTKEELAALLPGARLTREVERGEVHINTLKDGSITADYQSRTRNTGQLKGSGTWKISDDGKYCVEIKWNRVLEDVSGCRSMYKSGDDYYGAASDADDSKPNHYKISR
jgi:hypothetical protein